MKLDDTVKRLKENDPTLTSIYLTDNKIGPKETIAIADALKVNTTLTSIDLTDNEIDPKETIAIADALKINTTLTSIDLSRNKIGPDGTIAIADALKVNTTLTLIDLAWNTIGLYGAIAIADALKVNTTLTSINLDANEIDIDGAIAIADALKVNTTLTLINLSYNEMGLEGTIAIADALKVNTTLASIYLTANGLGPKGAIAIADALKVNTTLTSINLHSNGLGPKGAIAIADALKVNTTLASIYLHSNGLGPKGAITIASGLKANTTLASIYLGCNNNIGPKVEIAIADDVKCNPVIKSIYGIDNSKLRSYFNENKENPIAAYMRAISARLQESKYSNEIDSITIKYMNDLKILIKNALNSGGNIEKIEALIKKGSSSNEENRTNEKQKDTDLTEQIYSLLTKSTKTSDSQEETKDVFSILSSRIKAHQEDIKKAIEYYNNSDKIISLTENVYTKLLEEKLGEDSELATNMSKIDSLTIWVYAKDYASRHIDEALKAASETINSIKTLKIHGIINYVEIEDLIYSLITNNKIHASEEYCLSLMNETKPESMNNLQISKLDLSEAKFTSDSGRQFINDLEKIQFITEIILPAEKTDEEYAKELDEAEDDSNIIIITDDYHHFTEDDKDNIAKIISENKDNPEAATKRANARLINDAKDEKVCITPDEYHYIISHPDIVASLNERSIESLYIKEPPYKGKVEIYPMEVPAESIDLHNCSVYTANSENKLPEESPDAEGILADISQYSENNTDILGNDHPAEF